jgi:hypothetical protein
VMSDGQFRCWVDVKDREKVICESIKHCAMHLWRDNFLVGLPGDAAMEAKELNAW